MKMEQSTPEQPVTLESLAAEIRALRGEVLALQVDGIRAFRFRLWLGGLLIRLGAGVCGKWVHVEMEER